jgi:hypothetical protein
LDLSGLTEVDARRKTSNFRASRRLQIIPEPDGSPTDDFVIPEEFQLRQNRARTQ